MANKRVYDEVDGLTFADGGSGIDVGGLTSVGTDQSYLVNLDGDDDGAQGPSVADQAGQKVDFAVATTDVLQGIPLLISTLTGAEWYGHESGAATYGKGSLVNPICHTLRFGVQLGKYAAINVDGTCKFADGTKEFDDVEGWLAAQSAPTLTHPSRLWEPNTAAHGAISALHIQSLGFVVSPRALLLDRDGTDLGVTVVDIAGWKIAVDMTIRDATQQTGPPTHDTPTALIKQGTKDLTCSFEGVGDTDDYDLTIRNVKFRTKRKAAGKGWTGHTLSGVALFRDPADPWTARTLDDATPANRMINFVVPV